MAADSRPHQGLHRDSAAEPLPVAAHLRGRAAGADFEVQIRTEEMHRIAEEGIAAHWKYKEGQQGPGARRSAHRVAAPPGGVAADMQDPGEFMSTLKVDLYPEEVYTFTPRGKVIVLPRDATPIDFAYAIHSDVGQHLRRREGQRPHRAAAVRRCATATSSRS